MRELAFRQNGSCYIFSNREKNYERVFDCLAGRARAARGVAEATHAELAASLGACRRTILRAIALLEREGLIARRKAPNRPTQYRVFEVVPEAPFAPRFNGRKRRRRARMALISKLSPPYPRTPDKVSFNTYARERRSRSPAGSPPASESVAIATTLRSFGLSKPATIRAASENSSLELVAAWIRYVDAEQRLANRRGERSRIRSARCYVGAMTARGARLWPAQHRLAAAAMLESLDAPEARPAGREATRRVGKFRTRFEGIPFPLPESGDAAGAGSTPSPAAATARRKLAELAAAIADESERRQVKRPPLRRR